MSCVTFSKRSQPQCVPLELGCITLSYLLKRTGIFFRGQYTMLSAPRRSKLSIKDYRKDYSGKQYFIINLVHNLYVHRLIIHVAVYMYVM